MLDCRQHPIVPFATARGGHVRRNPVNWFEIYVQDMERAKRFYETVFQTTLNRLNSGDLEMWAFATDRDAPGTAGALVRMPGLPSGGNSTIVYFHCADCAVETARVPTAGGQVRREKMSIGEYGFVALVHDTEGNMIGLHSMQ
jgi:predicted enzyme related to lactoylglutathione lyase